MVLDVLAGAILLGVGLFIVYFAVEKDDDSNFLLHLLIGGAAIIAGAWIILTKITLALLLVKIAGIILILAGFFLAVNFPDTEDYQTRSMSYTSVLIGIILLIFGIYLLFFYA